MRTNMKAETMIILLVVMSVAIFLTLMYAAWLVSITPKEYTRLRQKQKQRRRRKL